MITEWNDKILIQEVDNIAEGIAKKGAKWIKRDAEINLKKYGAGELENEISVKDSLFKDGGYLVVAQASGNYEKYYASFFELGHYSSVYGKYKRPTAGVGSLKGISPVYIPPKPYLRPALNKNKKKILKAYQDALR